MALPKGITEKDNGMFDVRVGYKGRRYYIGTFNSLADARRMADQFRDNADQMYEVGGHELLQKTVDEFRAGYRKENPPPRTSTKRTIRARIEELEQRVKQLEALLLAQEPAQHQQHTQH